MRQTDLRLSRNRGQRNEEVIASAAPHGLIQDRCFKGQATRKETDWLAGYSKLTLSAEGRQELPNTTKPGWLARLSFLWNWFVRSCFDRRPRMSKSLKPWLESNRRFLTQLQARVSICIAGSPARAAWSTRCRPSARLTGRLPFTTAAPFSFPSTWRDCRPGCASSQRRCASSCRFRP